MKFESEADTPEFVSVIEESRIQGEFAAVFSQTVEYALRAVVHLAYMSPSASTTEQIAQATKVPQAYLSKVLQGLSRSGIVKSQRGIGGGVSLALDPSALTILQVVNAVDPLERIEHCPLGISSHGKHLCPLHRRIDQALEMVETAFKSTTLSEILAEPSSSKPLCDVQAAMEVLAKRAAAQAEESKASSSPSGDLSSDNKQGQPATDQTL